MKEEVLKKKTIFVTVFHSLVSKNIINTDALQVLLDSGKYTIVLLVPTHKVNFFIEQYAHKGFLFEPIDPGIVVFKRVEILMHSISMMLINTNFLRYKRHEILEKNKTWSGYFRHGVRELIVLLCADRLWIGKIFRYVDRLLAPKNVFAHIFDRYNPDLIFSTDVFEDVGAQFIREGQSRNIPTVGMVRSWDNCLSKGLLRALPDVYIVNNSVVKNELVNMHGVKEETITPVGLPQFDSFIKKEPASREEFFREHGLDPDKRLVLFAPGGSSLTDTDADIATILLTARDNGSLPNDIQFFIRNHPQHPADFGAIEKAKDLTIQTPGVILDRTTPKENELTRNDQDFLRNILAHTDVLVWLATSLCLDALVYDVPQVVVNFDGFDLNRTYYKSVRRYHDEGQMVKLFALNPFRVAHTGAELITYINMYLKDKSIDSKERSIAREQQLFRMDGESGKRIAEIITAHIIYCESRTPPTPHI